MSGDESPRSRIQAALKALKKYPDLHLFLVGDTPLIESYLDDANADRSRLVLVHADKTVAMDQKPSQALRTREHTSMWVALDMVAQNKAHACVSAGNTGALMAMGRFALKTFAGIDRPAIAGSVPTQKGSALMLDMGANVDCSSEQLYQFAVMGAQLVHAVSGIDRPKVGLLNIGVEDTKGNEEVRGADQLLRSDSRLNYVGYVEGHGVFLGQADVVVCDGFVGNVALKTGEGAAKLIHDRMLGLFQKSRWRRCLAFFVLPLLREFSRSVDPVLYNGAILLGLQGIVIKSHGGADAKGFYQAICEAVKEVDNNVPRRLAADVERMMR
ncbi:phosphate acyltransferase [Endozoicomonas sp. (ex Bugula neritina AB1)]|nr:phosphate acyltransferase [Endozoicomonas sp. (ex Bugula neritina AB1)]